MLFVYGCGDSGGGRGGGGDDRDGDDRDGDDRGGDDWSGGGRGGGECGGGDRSGSGGGRNVRRPGYFPFVIVHFYASYSSSSTIFPSHYG